MEAALSLLVFYVAASLSIPLWLWMLFLWQRPDEPGGALLYEAVHTGFWQAVWWLLLVVSATIVAVPVARSVWRRLTASRE